MFGGQGYSFGHDVWGLGVILRDLRCDGHAEVLVRRNLVRATTELPAARDVAFAVRKLRCRCRVM